MDEREYKLKMFELETKRIRVTLDFAKYGFVGTLWAAFAGMGLILALAILQTFTTYRLDPWAFVAIPIALAVSCVAFGFLSLGLAPNVAARFFGTAFNINAAGQQSQSPLPPTSQSTAGSVPAAPQAPATPQTGTGP